MTVIVEEDLSDLEDKQEEDEDSIFNSDGEDDDDDHELSLSSENDDDDNNNNSNINSNSNNNKDFRKEEVETTTTTKKKKKNVPGGPVLLDEQLEKFLISLKRKNEALNQKYLKLEKHPNLLVQTSPNSKLSCYECGSFLLVPFECVRCKKTRCCTCFLLNVMNDRIDELLFVTSCAIGSELCDLIYNLKTQIEVNDTLVACRICSQTVPAAGIIDHISQHHSNELDKKLLLEIIFAEHDIATFCRRTFFPKSETALNIDEDDDDDDDSIIIGTSSSSFSSSSSSAHLLRQSSRSRNGTSNSKSSLGKTKEREGGGRRGRGGSIGNPTTTIANDTTTTDSLPPPPHSPALKDNYKPLQRYMKAILAGIWEPTIVAEFNQRFDKAKNVPATVPTATATAAAADASKKKKNNWNAGIGVPREEIEKLGITGIVSIMDNYLQTPKQL